MNLSRYSDVTWASWCLKSWSTRLLFQQVAEAQQRKHQSSALYALMDPPMTRMVCCHTILQFKSLTEKFDFKWRHICSNSLKYWGRAKMADIFQTTFLKALYWMKMYKFRLRFHGSLFLGVPALVQIITWRRAGDKPLCEPMMICLLTHICVICVTRPQWVKDCDVLQLLYKHNYVTGIYNITVTSLEPYLSQILSYLTCFNSLLRLT